MPGKVLRTPKYALHKPSGQARVRIDGRDHYLGAFGSPESRDRRKVEHHNRARRVFIGPEAQEILRSLLDREPEAYCFSPAEAESERRSKPATGREYRKRYTKDSYNRAVQRACEVAFSMPRDIRRTVAKLPADEHRAARERLSGEASAWRAKYCWSPNQLRHARPTLIRARYYGLEASRVVLGHTNPQTTEIYAEPDFALTTEIMKQIG